MLKKHKKTIVLISPFALLALLVLLTVNVSAEESDPMAGVYGYVTPTPESGQFNPATQNGCTTDDQIAGMTPWLICQDLDTGAVAYSYTPGWIGSPLVSFWRSADPTAGTVEVSTGDASLNSSPFAACSAFLVAIAGNTASATDYCAMYAVAQITITAACDIAVANRQTAWAMLQADPDNPVHGTHFSVSTAMMIWACQNLGLVPIR